MHERSLKRFLGMVLITLVLATFSLAGDTHCPLIDPPPPVDGDGSGLVIVSPNVNTNPTVKDDSQFLKGFWEFFSQNADLF